MYKVELKHTLHLHKLADKLEEQGCKVYLEGQNWFEAKGGDSGSVINGKPDLIARNPDSSATIYDVKTGQPSTVSICFCRVTAYRDLRMPAFAGITGSGRCLAYSSGNGTRASDEIQVKLYMFLLPLSGHRRWLDVTFDGCLVYADGTEKRIAADAIIDEFKENVTTFMRRIVSNDPARHVPSERECRWCEVSSEDCSERVEPETA